MACPHTGHGKTIRRREPVYASSISAFIDDLIKQVIVADARGIAGTSNYDSRLLDQSVQAMRHAQNLGKADIVLHSR